MAIDYAIAAKAKAMFGKRLKEPDYHELINKNSIAEIASYLKNQTRYGSVLAGVNEHAVHRGYLELLIRNSYFVEFNRLLRYASENDDFLRYGVLNVESQQLMLTLYMLNDENRSDQIAQLPLAVNKYVHFDLNKLVHVKNIDELLRVIKDTPYYDGLKEFKGVSNRDLDVSECELIIKNANFQEILALINRRFKGEAKRQLIDLVDMQIELNNIAKIYRLKKYYRRDSEAIRKVITPVSARIPLKTLYEWIDSCSADQIIENLMNSPYKNYIDHKDFIYIEYHLNRIEFKINKKLMRFAQNPDVILVCYMTLLLYEIKNITNIIEGVRYSVASEKINQLLVY